MSDQTFPDELTQSKIMIGAHEPKLMGASPVARGTGESHEFIK